MRRNFELLLMLIGASVVGCSASPTASPSPTMELTSQGNAEQVAEESVVVSESAEAGPVTVEVVGGDEEALRGYPPVCRGFALGRTGNSLDWSCRTISRLSYRCLRCRGRRKCGNHQSGDESYWSVLVSVPLSTD
jgi:hypothetical protein